MTTLISRISSNNILLFIISISFLSACNSGGNNNTEQSQTLPTVEVEPLYSNNGNNWNDYLVNDGADRYSATDSACTGTETGGYSACLHGGEMRAVSLSSESSCSGLQINDALNAFDWVCDTSSGNVRFISKTLREHIYLSDLLDFSLGVWKNNSVSITKNSVKIAQSKPLPWWSNPVVTNAASLDTEGTIYLFDRSLAANYQILAQKIALVVKPGVIFSGDGLSVGSAVLQSGQNFLWMEGSFDSTGNYGISFSGMRFSVLKGFHSSNAEYVGVYFIGAENNLLIDVSISNAVLEGLSVASGSNYNLMKYITAYNNQGTAFRFAGSSNNVLQKAIFYNNHANAFTDNNSINNVVTQIISSNNRGHGIYLAGASNALMMHVSSVNNLTSNLYYNNAANNFIINSLMVNGLTGISFVGDSNNNFMHDTVTANNTTGISINASTSQNHFHGMLSIGNSTDCRAPTTDGFGLKTTSGSGPCLLDVSLSTATITDGVSTVNSFTGKAFEDVINSSQLSGVRLFDEIQDWTGFQNMFRTWGLDEASAFPASGHRSACTTGDTCRIWDWSLAEGDDGNAGNPVLKQQHSIPSGEKTQLHFWSASNDAECAAINNAVWNITQSHCSSEFLINTYEVLLDGKGNDNGLCESNETCVFTPNIGAYQGYGALLPVSFTDGTLTNITLLQYEFN